MRLPEHRRQEAWETSGGVHGGGMPPPRPSWCHLERPQGAREMSTSLGAPGRLAQHLPAPLGPAHGVGEDKPCAESYARPARTL